MLPYIKLQIIKKNVHFCEIFLTDQKDLFNVTMMIKRALSFCNACDVCVHNSQGYAYLKHK